MNLTENFLSIKRQIEILSNKTKLIVVSKNQSAESILSLINTGHEHFGENRVQESISKWTLSMMRSCGVPLILRTIAGLLPNDRTR